MARIVRARGRFGMVLNCECRKVNAAKPFKATIGETAVGYRYTFWKAVCRYREAVVVAGYLHPPCFEI